MLAAATMLLLLPLLLLLCLRVAQRCCCVRLRCLMLNTLHGLALAVLLLWACIDWLYSKQRCAAVLILTSLVTAAALLFVQLREHAMLPHTISTNSFSDHVLNEECYIPAHSREVSGTAGAAVCCLQATCQSQ
jgi:hypothetical protein